MLPSFCGALWDFSGSERFSALEGFRELSQPLKWPTPWSVPWLLTLWSRGINGHVVAIVSPWDRKCTWSAPFGTGPLMSDVVQHEVKYVLGKSNRQSLVSWIYYFCFETYCFDWAQSYVSYIIYLLIVIQRWLFLTYIWLNCLPLSLFTIT